MNLVRLLNVFIFKIILLRQFFGFDMNVTVSCVCSPFLLYFNVLLLLFLFFVGIYKSVCTIYIENLSVIRARMSAHHLICYAITNLISHKVWCTNTQTHMTYEEDCTKCASKCMHIRENPIHKNDALPRVENEKRKSIFREERVCGEVEKCNREWTNRRGYHFILHTWLP